MSLPTRPHEALSLRNSIESGLFFMKFSPLTTQATAAEGKTPLYFAADGEFTGLIAVADTVRPEAAAAVARIKSMGCKVLMLTGDNAVTAAAIAGKLGIEYVAEVLPADKESEIRRLQSAGYRVAMVGDGINDAPALARADTGIAVGSGTDVAIEAADVVLMRRDVGDVAAALELSRATIRNIRENLFWAFFYNALCIPVAAGAFAGLGLRLNPMIAAAAMSLSSVCVVLNALRLRFFTPSGRKKANAARADCGDSCVLRKSEISSEERDGNKKESEISQVGKGENKKESDISSEEKGENNMKRKVIIGVEGMSCGHCSARVEKALNSLDGVTASVELDNKRAVVECDAGVGDEALRAAVEDAGYEVTGIKRE